MRKVLFLFLMSGSLLLMSYEPVYYEYTPVFMQRDEMEKAIRLEAPKDIKNPGKIYIHGSTLFINEKYKGFHIIDNSNPSSPKNKAFLHIDGCLDIAVKWPILYADNATDLVAIRMNAEISSIAVEGRVKDALPEPSSPQGLWMTGTFEKFRPENGIIVRWEKNESYE